MNTAVSVALAPAAVRYLPLCAGPLLLLLVHHEHRPWHQVAVQADKLGLLTAQCQSHLSDGALHMGL